MLGGVWYRVLFALGRVRRWPVPPEGEVSATGVDGVAQIIHLKLFRYKYSLITSEKNIGNIREVGWIRYEDGECGGEGRFELDLKVAGEAVDAVKVLRPSLLGTMIYI